MAETNMACIDYRCGDSLNAIGPPNHALYSPACMHYDEWQQKIKEALDPQNMSDAAWYTDPTYVDDPPEEAVQAMERAANDRTEIEDL